MAAGIPRGGIRITKTHAYISVFVAEDAANGRPGIEWSASVERTSEFDAMTVPQKAAALVRAVKDVRTAQLTGEQTLAISGGNVTL